MAAALPTLDFRGIRDPSAYVRSLLRRATAGGEETKDEPVAPMVSLSAWNAVVEAVTAVPCLAVAGEAEAILQGSLPVKAPLAVDLALALEFDGTDVEPLHVARDADTVRALVLVGSDVNALDFFLSSARCTTRRGLTTRRWSSRCWKRAPGPVRASRTCTARARATSPRRGPRREAMDAHIAKLRQERAERNKSMRTAEDWSRALEALDTARSEAVRAGRDAKTADDEVDAIKRRDGTVLTAKVLDNGAVETDEQLVDRLGAEAKKLELELAEEKKQLQGAVGGTKVQKQRERIGKLEGALNRLRGELAALERQGEAAARAPGLRADLERLRESKYAVLRTDVASAKIRQTLTSTVTNEEDLKGGVVAAAPDASLAFLDHSTPVKLIGQAFGSFFQLPPAERAATLKALKDVAKHFKKAPNTSVYSSPGGAPAGPAPCT